MVIVIDETRILSGPMQKRYNICLYWGREHYLRLKENTESTIVLIDQKYDERGTTLEWNKKIILTITDMNDKIKIRIKMEPIAKAIDKEEHIPGMRMFWADILTSFWQYHNVDLTDEYYREYYPIENIKRRCKIRYNQVKIMIIANIINILTASYFFSYAGLSISIIMLILVLTDELFLKFRNINIVKVSKMLYPDIDPIEPWKMRLIYRYDSLVTLSP